MKEPPQPEQFSTMFGKRPSSSSYPLMYGACLDIEVPACFQERIRKSERRKDTISSWPKIRRGGYFQHLLEPSAWLEEVFERSCSLQGAQEHCGTGRERNLVDRSVCRGVGLV